MIIELLVCAIMPTRAYLNFEFPLNEVTVRSRLNGEL